MYSKFQYISQGVTASEQIKNIQSALDAGCQWIQVRFKNQNEKAVTALAEVIKKCTLSHNVTVIINDWVKVAKEVDADGVHLGLTDLSISEARAILGHDKIIGGTANTLQDVVRRIHENCNYVGLGPFRFTVTKEKLSPILGTEGYQKIMEGLAAMNLSIPIYAVGGIELNDVPEILKTPIYGIALSSEITRNTNKKELVEQLNRLLDAHK